MPIETRNQTLTKIVPCSYHTTKYYLKRNYLQNNCHGENIQNWVNCEYTILTCNFAEVIVVTLSGNRMNYHYLNQRFVISTYSIILVWKMTNNVSIMLPIKRIFFLWGFECIMLYCAIHGMVRDYTACPRKRVQIFESRHLSQKLTYFAFIFLDTISMVLTL